jgi:hypothetical protein
VALAGEYNNTQEPRDRNDRALASVNIIFDFCKFILCKPHAEDAGVKPLCGEAERYRVGFGEDVLVLRIGRLLQGRFQRGSGPDQCHGRLTKEWSVDQHQKINSKNKYNRKETDDEKCDQW